MSNDPYRQQSLQDDPYVDAWKSLRRSRRNVWVAFFTWPIVIAVGIKILHALIGAGEQNIAPFVAIPVFLVMLTLLGTFHFSCPQCGENFYRKGPYRNAFSAACLHCGIRVGTPKGTSSAKGEQHG